MAEKDVAQEQVVLVLHCTSPGCVTEATADRMRVPAWDSLKAANGGRRVYARDLAKFAVCGKCGYRLKEQFGVKTFPYADAHRSAMKREEEEAQVEAKRVEARAKEQADALKFKAFAEAFLPRAGIDALPVAATKPASAPTGKQEGRRTGKTANKRAKRLAAKHAAQPAAQPAAPAPAPDTDVVPNLALDPAASSDAQPASEAEAQSAGNDGVATA